MSSKMIYFTLSHFNSSIRDFFLTKGGYTSLLDYELTADNPLFEIYWNSKKESFEQEASSIKTFNDSEYIHEWVSIHSLSTEVKDYLWHTYLSIKYDNFDIYLMQKNISSTILVYVPIRRNLSASSKTKYYNDWKNDITDVSSFSNYYADWKNGVLNVPTETSYYNDWFGIHKIKTETKTETEKNKENQHFQFHLNPKTRNSYILSPTCPIEEFKKKYPERFGRNGWNLFHDERVVYYSKTYNGFIVSKKYKDDLIQFGAKMI
jgi:hypothetical protein